MVIMARMVTNWVSPLFTASATSSSVLLTYSSTSLTNSGGALLLTWFADLPDVAEYALAGNWSLKGEYDYLHLAGHDVTLNGSATQAGVTAPLTTPF